MGYTANESIIKFFDELDLYAAARSQTNIQKLALLLASVQGLARTYLESVYQAGGAVESADRPPAPDAEANDAARAHHNQLCQTAAEQDYTAIRTNLRTHYYTDNIRQGFRDEITNL